MLCCVGSELLLEEFWSDHSGPSGGGVRGKPLSSVSAGSQYCSVLVSRMFSQSQSCCSCRVPSGVLFVTVVNMSLKTMWYWGEI